MSSIYGIVEDFQDKKGMPQDLNTIKEALCYWEPDGEGMMTSENIGLGQLLLHNTIESKYEQQPYSSVESKCTIVADARLDNRDELAELLNLSSKEVQLIPDSQLILKSYEKWGSKCVNHLFGDFAFSIWDSKSKEFFCVRDHIGIKPFFYHLTNSKFIFASEIKGILALPFVKAVKDEQWIADYMILLVPNKTDTLYKNIFRLPPAHSLKWVNGKITIEKYWELESSKELTFKDEDACFEAFHAEFSRAVKCRLNSSFPVSAELSGGLDSGAIAVLANQLSNEPKNDFYTYSQAFPLVNKWEGPRLSDERQVIDQLIKKAKIKNHKYVTLEQQGFISEMDKVIQHIDEVPKNNFNLWSSLLHQEASKNGSRVLLSGFGGDQMITYNGQGYLNELFRLGKWSTLWNDLRHKKNASKSIRNLLGIVFHTVFPKKEFLPQFSRISDSIPFSTQQLEHYKLAERGANLRDFPLGSIANRQKIMLLGNGLFDRVENGTLMLKSKKMEYRYPLLDVRLLTFFNALPLKYKMYNGERGACLKRSVKDYMPLHLYKKKHNDSFTVPYALHWVYNDRETIKNFINSLAQEKSIFNLNQIENEIMNVEESFKDGASRNPAPSLRALLFLRKYQ